MIDFLLSTEARFAFFVKGRWVLLVSDPVRPPLVPALMRVAETFVEHVPRVVYELWPSPFRDDQGHPLSAGDEAYGLAVALAEQEEGSPWSRPRPQRGRRRGRPAGVRPRRQRGRGAPAGSVGRAPRPDSAGT